MKRFVTDYANYRISCFLEDQKRTGTDHTDEIRRIDRIHFSVNAGLLSIDDGMRELANVGNDR